ncbi:MAG: MFS transporter [Chloroflexota bacterium]
MQNESVQHDAGAATLGSRVVAPPPTLARSEGFMARTFSALRHQNYRYYFIGQLVSQIGTWMQMVAQGWLVYELTKSPFFLGLVSFASSIPVLCFSLWSGVIVDRFPRRTVLLITQINAMLLAFILSALVFTGVVQPWHILILSSLLGINSAFDNTARQTFVKDMVGREDMPNAIALNSALFNLSRIIGPSLAGIALATVGPAWCFLLNGLSFLAVIYGIWRMTMPKFVPPARTGSMLAEITEGINYVRDNETIRTLIGVVAITTVFGFAYTTLMPAYAREVLMKDTPSVDVLRGVFKTNDEQLSGILVGFQSTAVGIGSLAGALLAATFSTYRRKGKLLTVGNLVFPAMLILLALSRSLPFSLLCLSCIGFGFMVQQSMANTLVQSNVPDRLRGRVMSVYTLGFFGMSPLGALQSGTVAQQFGVPAGIGVGATIALLFSLLILWRVPRVRNLE